MGECGPSDDSQDSTVATSPSGLTPRPNVPSSVGSLGLSRVDIGLADEE